MSPTNSWLDIKLAVRMLVKNPGVTLTGILGLSVATAIGATVFSALHALHDRALPVEGGERVVAIENFDAASRSAARGTHLHDLQAWRGEVRGVEQISAYRVVDRNLVTPDDWVWFSGTGATIEVEESRQGAEPTRHTIEFLRVGPSLFDIYGVPMLAGRSLQPADLAGAATAVVANRSFVHKVLGGSVALGRRVRYADTEDGAMPGAERAPGTRSWAWSTTSPPKGTFPARTRRPCTTRSRRASSTPRAWWSECRG